VGLAAVVDVGAAVVAGLVASAVGRGVRVGLGVGAGATVGLGVGFGVGFGVGAAMTTRAGDTAASVTVRSPGPLPLVASNRYGQDPDGSVMAVVYVTPSSTPVAGPLRPNRPRPLTSTSMTDGAQPATSVYRTENVMIDDGVPEPGDAFPTESVGAAWDAPLQLAALTVDIVAGRSSAPTAAATTRVRVKTRIPG
jgi:hypothetical protein